MGKKVVAFIFFIIILGTGSAAFASHREYEVHFINAGQSDCILIRSPNKNYLIDTGAPYHKNKIIEYLDKNEINCIEGIILTHYHKDHYGGLQKIVENKKVEWVCLPIHENEMQYELYKSLMKKGVKVKYISKGFKLKQGMVNLKAIAPFKEDKVIENNNSLVLQGQIDGIRYLFAGDCEKAEEEDMLNSGELKKCDILKVPHHSLSTSSTDEFLNKVKPRIAVVTCNGVETPDLNTLKRINSKKTILFRTDFHGDIVIRNGFISGSKDGINVRVK